MFVITCIITETGAIIGRDEFHTFSAANAFYEMMFKVPEWSVTFDYMEKVA